MTPTDEQKRQWRRAMQYLPLSLVRDMADAFRDALAEVRRLEFWSEHDSCRFRGVYNGLRLVGYKWDCFYGEDCDPRHNYLADDWKQAAEKELSE